MAAVDVPLKMSQWMRENECASAGQMSLNIPMKMVFASWIQLLHNWTKTTTWCSPLGTTLIPLPVLFNGVCVPGWEEEEDLL